jgi:endonuclease/exonuclease/phosphatase family metal-dependent hydrolase
MSNLLRVATVNLLNDLSRWDERRALLAAELGSLSLDLIALQEVVNPTGSSTAHALAHALGGYSVHVSPKAGRSRTREGIAILSRLPVTRHETLDLRSQQRTAQFAEVELGGVSVLFANTHCYWPPGIHAPRVRQIKRLLDWLNSRSPQIPAIVSGDFNATPDSRALAVMRASFASAHVACHGAEPDFTFPTPLVSHNFVRSTITRSALRIFSNRPRERWRGTLDYIFVSSSVAVSECGLILTYPSATDPTLYASDHFGLTATLCLADPRENQIAD